MSKFDSNEEEEEEEGEEDYYEKVKLSLSLKTRGA